ncbi:MAG: hypothetical protein K2Y29_10340 [Beijerinckiaceae bacterium]|nr:hypothetical protein [Beijerinckiaceae bacterium]
MRDMHNNISVLHAISPQAVGTSGIAGGKLSDALDRRGYDQVEFVYSSGASASVADTITPVVYEGDTTNGSFTSVANADLLGTEAALTLTAAKSGRVGYQGNKRYLKIRLYGTGTATAVVAAVAVLGAPERAPTA